ncbi:MBOAT family O-acyltransferase [Pseudodesulfovibrio sp.]|uniref:MBOAT family O-acyltransferase n=1 Tax=Pseudodesulfovibrio sp. TaxID=2035812 RepID=UPI00261B37AA|nr:MBOAT family O-acyltransferase [Pseudodesulfovibrio sp.]MDD3312788.1 MBOAT family protein [Pseudodesulfovibrio sp.]
MIFNSLEFIAFILVTGLLYFVLPPRRRWVLLLAASYVFYGAWNVKYTALMAVTTATAWLCGEAVARSGTARARKGWVAACLALNLGILAVFKYHAMIASSVTAVLSSLGSSLAFRPLDVLLPVGISFYTFQALSYVIDVYRDPAQRERHPGLFALYIAFFPQLVAGPIERAGNILPQLRRTVRFDLDRIGDGLALALWGYFKKLMIADRLGVFVDQIYAAPGSFSPLQVSLATLFFSFQIYCDFSAYTDIARGVAQVFGIDLMENFRTPYFATSIRDFWRRWHISLSTWFRDYMYIPLGGSRLSPQRTLLNVLVVFAVCGLWHGASWNFVIWGTVHGLMLCVLVLWRRALPKRAHGPALDAVLDVGRALCLFTAVTLAWVFFRAADLSQAMAVFSKIFHLVDARLPHTGLGPLQDMKALLLSVPVDGNTHGIILSLVGIAVLLAVDLASRKNGFLGWYKGLGLVPRWGLCYFLFFATLVFGRLGITKFVYFQF